MMYSMHLVRLIFQAEKVKQIFLEDHRHAFKKTCICWTYHDVTNTWLIIPEDGRDPNPAKLWTPPAPGCAPPICWWVSWVSLQLNTFCLVLANKQGTIPEFGASLSWSSPIKVAVKISCNPYIPCKARIRAIRGFNCENEWKARKSKFHCHRKKVLSYPHKILSLKMFWKQASQRHIISKADQKMSK